MIGFWKMLINLFIRPVNGHFLPILWEYDKIFVAWGRGVVANMRPCQGRDRGFDTRRSRQAKKRLSEKGVFLYRDRRYPQGRMMSERHSKSWTQVTEKERVLYTEESDILSKNIISINRKHKTWFFFLQVRAFASIKPGFT